MSTHNNNDTSVSDGFCVIIENMHDWVSKEDILFMFKSHRQLRKNKIIGIIMQSDASRNNSNHNNNNNNKNNDIGGDSDSNTFTNTCTVWFKELSSIRHALSFNGHELFDEKIHIYNPNPNNMMDTITHPFHNINVEFPTIKSSTNKHTNKSTRRYNSKRDNNPSSSSSAGVGASSYPHNSQRDGGNKEHHRHHNCNNNNPNHSNTSPGVVLHSTNVCNKGLAFHPKKVYEYSESFQTLLHQVNSLSRDDLMNLIINSCKSSLLTAADYTFLNNRLADYKQKNTKQSIKHLKSISSITMQQQSNPVPQPSSSSSTSISYYNKNALLPTSTTTNDDMNSYYKEEQKLQKLSSFSIPKNIVIPSSAWETNLIIRGDILDKSEYVCLDVEKLVKSSTHDLGACNVCFVNECGTVGFYALCYFPPEDVCNYQSKIHGIREDKLQTGIPYQIIQGILNSYLTKMIINGWDLDNDLISMGYDHPNHLRFDVQEFYKDSFDKKMALEDLSIHFLGVNLQMNSAGNPMHSVVRDARLHLLAYKKMIKYKEQHPNATRFQCNGLDEYRRDKESNKLKHKKMYSSACTCGLKSSKLSSDKIGPWNSIKNSEYLGSTGDIDLQQLE